MNYGITNLKPANIYILLKELNTIQTPFKIYLKLAFYDDDYESP